MMLTSGSRAFIAVALAMEVAYAGDPQFEVRTDKEVYLLYEDIWATVEGRNQTANVLQAMAPVIGKGRVEIEIFDSGGVLVGDESGCVLGVPSEADTITSGGSLRQVVRLNFLMHERDTITSRLHVPVGAYTAIFSWNWMKRGTPSSGPMVLTDTVRFAVVEPVAEERQAMAAYMSALAQPTCPARTAALWACSQTYRESAYADECLELLSILLGNEGCAAPGVDRIRVGLALVLYHPDHPGVKANVSMVYRLAAQSVFGDGKRVMMQILDSVPRGSNAAAAAEEYLRSSPRTTGDQ